MSEKNKRDLDATKASLLSAAKELLLGCSDPEKVTSRAIAGRAGVNVAMINYCFGSRESLLYEVYKELLGKAQMSDTSLTCLSDPSIPPRDKLFLVHYTFMKLMIENFTLSRAVTQYILLHRSDEAGLESQPLIKEHFAGSKTDEECALIAFELTSLHEIAVLQHNMLMDKLGVDLTDDNVLREYVKKNIDRFLGQ